MDKSEVDWSESEKLVMEGRPRFCTPPCLTVWGDMSANDAIEA